jgi:putative membrane protein
MTVQPALGFRDGIVFLLTAFLVGSALDPQDFLTWVLEVFWVAGAIVLWAVWLRRVRCTRIVFWALILHSVVLIVGGIYTYSLVPAGAWMQELLARPRNDYDRLGHFMQGFAPALLWREVFLRNAIVRGRGWLFVIVNGMCLAFAAAFELLEFAVAMILGEASWAYLGSQGDIWDAQWDMLFCVIGANAALLALGPVQDREMRGEAARCAGVTPP